MNQNQIIIEYCTGCRWLLRSAWFAQELLTTFEEELFRGMPKTKNRSSRTFSDFLQQSSFFGVEKKTSGFPDIRAQKKSYATKSLQKDNLGIWTDSLMRIFPLGNLSGKLLRQLFLIHFFFRNSSPMTPNRMTSSREYQTPNEWKFRSY